VFQSRRRGGDRHAARWQPDLTVDYLSDLAEAVAGAGFRAIRVTPRGAGTSTGPTDGLTLHDFAGDVAGVIQELDLAPGFVLGHAFGNRIARTVAADRPELVRGVILVAAGGKGRTSTRGPAGLGDPVHANRLGGRGARGHAMDGGRTRERLNGVAAVQELSRASRCRRPDGRRPVHPAQDWWAPPGDVPYLVVQGLNDQAAPEVRTAALLLPAPRAWKID
jgi:pimeloyl-ACP methyl ester carboxylesterase